MNLLNIISHKFNWILFFSIFLAIFTSFFLQYKLDLVPCKLCVYQRYLWLILFFLSTLNLLFGSKIYKIIKSLILFFLAALLLLSFYHSGIELGFFNNIITCTQESNVQAETIDQLDAMIRETKNSDCAFPKFYIYKITLSNLSMILSGILFLLSLRFLKRNIS